MQFDADKILAVKRSGSLSISLLREDDPDNPIELREYDPDEPTLQNFAEYDDDDDPGLPNGRLRGDMLDFEPSMPTWLACAIEKSMDHPGEEIVLGCYPVSLASELRVRFYVSSVCYQGGVVVHDGLDDKVAIRYGRDFGAVGSEIFNTCMLRPAG